MPINLRIKGQLEQATVLSFVDPDTIRGITIISDEASYWFKIISDDCFEIRSCSNIMGRSGATLLIIQRIDEGKWLVKNGMPLEIIKETRIFQNDEEMALGVFNILAEYGNLYTKYQNDVAEDASSHRYLIDVENATLYVDGFCWLSSERF